MRVTASQLRADVYNLLDGVLNSGEPLEIERNGRVLRITAERPRNWMDHLVVRDGAVTGDSEDLVSIDWSVYWNPDEQT